MCVLCVCVCVPNNPAPGSTYSLLDGNGAVQARGFRAVERPSRGDGVLA